MPVVTLADIRAEGVTVAMASDAKVNQYISTWEAAFESACGQWFGPRDDVTVTLDGNDGQIAFFQVPIIEVDSLTDTALDEVIDPSDYRVYSGRTLLQDDRRNPKIAMRNNRRFTLGRQRWEVVGSFGFTEADGSVPGDVHYAMLLLIIEKLLTPKILNSDALLLPPLPDQLGPKVEEVTDDHKLKWQPTAAKQSTSFLDGLTNSSIVKKTAAKYRAPMKIRTQSEWSFRANPTLGLFTDVFGES